jgi:mannose-6-phosphate isomerase-like protein (cupin superfamily)
MKRIEKPWGEEVWLAHNELYACKIIRMRKGTRSSLQYHRQKHETIYIQKGLARATLEDETGTLTACILRPGDIIENRPFRKHRLEALEDTELIEASTPHLDDVVRVEDDYDR